LPKPSRLWVPHKPSCVGRKLDQFPLRRRIALPRSVCFWLPGIIFLGSTHQDLGNLNHNGTRPFLLYSIFLGYLIYSCRVYLVFTHSLHIHSSFLYFILACTDVIRKVCSCVHIYTKATYDVHAVFSVHVCHSLIHSITCFITV